MVLAQERAARTTGEIIGCFAPGLADPVPFAKRHGGVDGPKQHHPRNRKRQHSDRVDARCVITAAGLGLSKILIDPATPFAGSGGLKPASRARRIDAQTSRAGEGSFAALAPAGPAVYPLAAA